MRQPAPQPAVAAAPLGSLSFLVGEARGDRRRLQLGLALAAVTHLTLFAVTWPQLAPRPADDARRVIHVLQLQPVKLIPPEQRLMEVPRPPARPVPIPDPTPDAPEILTPQQPVMTDIPVDLEVLPTPADIPAPPPEDTTVVVAGIDITPPVLLHKVEPTYTTAALYVRKEGAVVLELTIGRDGRVTDAKPLRGLGYGLTEKALEAARQWRFEPSTYHGKPVEVIYRLTVQFRIR